MTLTYVTFLSTNVDRLAQFYVDALGLEEIEASRDHRYREVIAGGCKIGFAYAGAYETLGLAEDANPTGFRSVLTFAVGSVAEVGPGADRAVAAGATLVKPGFDTFFGQHQAVLRDPDGNVFRISAPIGS
ncbi:VOC family protein [Flavisphingomonas formosensis]|uniref:VOC family protein n=1 Tax=Flavisphingomonas formosensis TaxID=861534 RepID=UPI0012F8DE1F|nr:VOC family protein [Sphingomonas formosensis]